MTKPANPLRVVLFSGGRGTTTLSDALHRYPDIELTTLVNAYDDGLSTGLLRRFIPGMLGPSDIRKVISGLLKHRSDRPSEALRQLLEYRLPDPIETKHALQLIEGLINFEQNATSADEILAIKEGLSLSQARLVSRYLRAFLDYYHQAVKEKSWFNFSDNSVGNLIFAGCFLLSDHDFNRAISDFSRLAELEGHLVNVTMGENLVLIGLKEDGRILFDEASIVGPQDKARIEEIFLLPRYLEPDLEKNYPSKEGRIRWLRQLETLPMLNPAAEQALRAADVIIYGPGTQHSSLYPSYLTVGLAEAIRANKRAEKIFIANIARDNDILTEDATTLVQGFMLNMSRKQTYPVKGQHLVSRFFFQKPEKTNSTELDYLPFEAGQFKQPLEKVVWVDLEGDKGKHSGGRTVSELLLIIEGRLRRRIRHVSHKVSIIVPALNEGRTIKRVLQDLKDLQFPELGLEKEIIVVDGGSTDKTYEIAQSEPSVRTYQVSGKKGRGSALRLGIEKAKGEIIVFFPADGEYQVSDIPRIVAPLLSQEFPVVFGSRAFRNNNLGDTLRHVYGNRGISFLISKYGGMLLTIMVLLGYGRYISDTFTSVKGFNARILRGMDFRRYGVDFDMEMIAKIARAGHPILEIPVAYTARTVEQGKKTTVWDGIKSLLALMRFPS